MLCGTCTKFTKSGFCLFYKLKITIPIYECENHTSEAQIINAPEIPKVIKPWNKGTVGICKPNSGSFKKGMTPFNKGKKGLQVAWNKGTKGVCKPNSGCFKKGHIPKNKKIHEISNVEIPKFVPEVVPDSLIQPHIIAPVETPVSSPIPSIVSPIPAPMEPDPVIVPVLSEEDKLKAVFKKMEAQRQLKIASYKVEESKEPVKKMRMFNKILCLKEGKYIKCKKPKAFCSQWEFCHRRGKA